MVCHTMPVPFGRKQRKLMTEATSVVTGEELQKHPVTILQNAFYQHREWYGRLMSGLVNLVGRKQQCIFVVSVL